MKNMTISTIESVKPLSYRSFISAGYSSTILFRSTCKLIRCGYFVGRIASTNLLQFKAVLSNPKFAFLKSVVVSGKRRDIINTARRNR